MRSDFSLKTSSWHLNGFPDGVLNFCLFRAVKTVRLVLKMYSSRQGGFVTARRMGV